MIVSFCPGRIRLRFKELKDQAVADMARTRLMETPGITKAEVNTLTGSILVEYDAEILPVKKLLDLGRRELAKFNIRLDIPEQEP
jgi:hypothetical protein